MSATQRTYHYVWAHQIAGNEMFSPVNGVQLVAFVIEIHGVSRIDLLGLAVPIANIIYCVSSSTS